MNMTKWILLWVLVSCASLISMEIVDKHTLQIHEPNNKVTVYFVNPCTTVHTIIKDSQAKYATEHLECNYGYKHSKYEIQLCEEHFKADWLGALQLLSACPTNIKNKRSISLPSIIQSPTVITAATNLLKSSITKGERKDIMNEVGSKFSANDITINVMRDVFLNSNNVINDNGSPEENTLPGEIAMLFAIHRQITLKSALLRRIAKSCRTNAQLSTKALAELLDNNDLANIPKNITRIIKIYVDLKQSVFEIDFETNEAITFDDNVSDRENRPTTPTDNISPNSQMLLIFTILIGFSVLIICAFIAFYYILSKSVKTQLEQSINLQPMNMPEV
jgi:hypothetical protein